MPERDSEVYSNPLPPSLQHDNDDEDDGMSAHPMTNEDFRKLMMTPRVPDGQAPASAAKPSSKRVPEHKESDDVASERKKKKSYYAKLKKLEEDRQKELAAKYRDRARERRDGTNNDYEQTKMISTTADYRAVAPDAQAGENYAERRKQLIQESKYLGGDMEHTHLVKGLDYALLEKVRAEISSKEIEEEEMEAVLETRPSRPEKEEEPDEPQFKTRLGKSVYRQQFRNKPPERNELFLPGRMAYVVDLEDEAESDIPTTLIRSKADCPTLESTTTLTTNDIVINKLTQILSYLRQGKREAKKLKKKEKGKVKEEERPKMTDESIYGDIGDYNPGFNKGKDTTDRDKDRDRRDRDRRDRDRDRDRDHRDRARDYRGGRDRDRDRDRERDRGRDGRDRGRDRDRERDRDRDRNRDHDRDRDGRQDREREKKSYFEKPVEEDDERLADRTSAPGSSAKELVKSINQRFGKLADEGHGLAEGVDKDKKTGKDDVRINKLKKKMEVDSYAECYPGMMESADAIDDSDDEVDYMKMDQGNKKGPVGRWDFDTQEEYSDYMSNKEALPKAAFQYGVKMADGRKTRRTGPKDEKKKVDREWQKIQNIIAKRKNMGTGGPSSKSGRYN